MKTLDQRLDEANNQLYDAAERHNRAAYDSAVNKAASLSYQMGLFLPDYEYHWRYSYNQ